MWRAMAERLSRSVIKGVHDSCELLIGYPSEVLVFREELTDQAIRIFVPPPRSQDVYGCAK